MDVSTLKAKRLASTAGEAFRGGELERSAKLYTDALDQLNDLEADSEAGSKIRNSVLVNRAAVFLKLREDDFVVEDCSEVLEAQPNHCKALYRRARALANQQRWVRGCLAAACSTFNDVPHSMPWS
jgi:hypothetical protein